MITIYVEDREKVAAVRAAVEWEFMTNPCWNGADFEVVPGDYTGIDGASDEVNGSVLLHTVVYPAIDGDEG